MKDPNSPLTRLRIWLASHLDPYPDAGESWCVNCAQNSGQTRVFPADGIQAHVQQHQPEDSIMIRTRRPAS